MKNKIILTIVFIGTIAIGGIGFNFFNEKNNLNEVIETVNAFVDSNSVSIKAETDGIIKLLPTNSSKVSKGDVIAEIQTQIKTETLEQKENLEKDYENAALMYKDGILSQEEYDKKIDKLSTKPQSPQTKTTIKTIKIYAPIDGEIVLNETKTGDKITQNKPIGHINSAEKEINAHFSVSKQNLIKPGSPVEISIIKYPERIFKGIITEISSPDAAGLPVKIKFNDTIKDLNLNNGDSALIRLIY